MINDYNLCFIICDNVMPGAEVGQGAVLRGNQVCMGGLVARRSTGSETVKGNSWNSCRVSS